MQIDPSTTTDHLRSRWESGAKDVVISFEDPTPTDGSADPDEQRRNAWRRQAGLL